MSARIKLGGLFTQAERREQHAGFNSPLNRLNEIINWEFFRSEIEHAAKYSNKGRRAHDAVLMLKILVLQRYYDLSEEQTEFQILDRLSFQKFLGLEVGGRVPDKNSIWDFKERIGKEGVEAVFARFNEHLEAVGLRARGGTIVDASFVDVPRQRNGREENKLIKEGGKPEDWSDKKSAHKDIDARWTKKNEEKHFGYKNHAKVSRKTKMVDAYSVTAASVHDSQVFLELLDPEKDSDVWADSAYQSAANKGALKKLGIRNHIHERAYRNKPLNDKQKKHNTRRSRVRARVEHPFAFVKMMGGDWLRTIGEERAARGVGLTNFTYNLFRLGQIGHAM